MSFRGNIDRLSVQNKAYRKVIHTNEVMQLVVMSLLPGEEIGTEIHPRTSQFIRVEEGLATVVADGKKTYLKADDVVIIDPGVEHNVWNRGDTELKIYTIYTPPEHHEGLKQTRKE